jgi:Acetokinase family
VVHGGIFFSGPVLIDAKVRVSLDELPDLAPPHQPKSLAGLDAVSRQLPDVPSVACFDTRFPHHNPSGVGLRMVTCHLGANASLAAVVDGRSVDTTMGFTPLKGLMIATRSGTIDPGLLLWLEARCRCPHLRDHGPRRSQNSPRNPNRHHRIEAIVLRQQTSVLLARHHEPNQDGGVAWDSTACGEISALQRTWARRALAQVS